MSGEFVMRMPRSTYRILVVDLGILVGDAVVCLLNVLVNHPLQWYLPAVMLLLLATLLLLVVVGTQRVYEWRI